jgi:hypothetical protein
LKTHNSKTNPPHQPYNKHPPTLQMVATRKRDYDETTTTTTTTTTPPPSNGKKCKVTKQSTLEKAHFFVASLHWHDDVLSTAWEDMTFADGSTFKTFWCHTRTPGWKEKHPNAFKILSECEKVCAPDTCHPCLVTMRRNLVAHARAFVDQVTTHHILPHLHDTSTCCGGVVFDDGTSVSTFWQNCIQPEWRETHPDAYTILAECETLRNHFPLVFGSPSEIPDSVLQTGVTHVMDKMELYELGYFKQYMIGRRLATELGVPTQSLASHRSTIGTYIIQYLQESQRVKDCFINNYIYSDKPWKQLTALMLYRKLLCGDDADDEDTVCPTSVVSPAFNAALTPYLLTYLDINSPIHSAETFVGPKSESIHFESSMHFEALWILTNIIATGGKPVDIILNHNGVALIRDLFIYSEKSSIHEQAIWALSNLAGDSAIARTMVIESDVIMAVYTFMQSTFGTLSLDMKRTISWAMINFASGCVTNDHATQTIGIVAALLNDFNNDSEVTTNSYRSFSKLLANSTSDHTSKTIVDGQQFYEGAFYKAVLYYGLHRSFLQHILMFDKDTGSIHKNMRTIAQKFVSFTMDSYGGKSLIFELMCGTMCDACTQNTCCSSSLVHSTENGWTATCKCGKTFPHYIPGTHELAQYAIQSVHHPTN